MMARRVLVTGGNGYLASHIIHQLLDLGIDVNTTVRHPTDSRNDFLRRLHPVLQKKPGNLKIFAAQFSSDTANNDLTCWEEALDGCDSLIHSAAPAYFMTETEGEFLSAAEAGTIAVLQACVNKDIKIVVLTSSVYAVDHGHSNVQYVQNYWQKIENPDQPITMLKSPLPVYKETPVYTFTERDYAVKSRLRSYSKSKLQAEVAAHNFVEGAAELGYQIHLGIVCPSICLGPPLSRDQAHALFNSNGIVLSAMKNLALFHPPLGDGMVDVRDAAHAHIKVLEKIQRFAKNQPKQRYCDRFIITATKGQPFSQISKWMNDIINSEMRMAGVQSTDTNVQYISSYELPIWLARVLAYFDLPIPSISRNFTEMGLLGNIPHIENQRALNELAIQFRHPANTLYDHMAAVHFFDAASPKYAQTIFSDRNVAVYEKFLLSALGGLTLDKAAHPYNPSAWVKTM